MRLDEMVSIIFCLLMLLAVLLSIDNGQRTMALQISIIGTRKKGHLQDFIFEKKRKDES
jgi:hypothetical protein